MPANGKMKDQSIDRSESFYFHNIHNVLSIESNVNLDMPEFFRCETSTPGQSLLAVTVKKDIPDLTDDISLVGLQARYNRLDDVLYFEHPWSSSVLPIKLSIKHLNETVTEVCATRLFHRYAHWFDPTVKLGKIVRQLMTLKFLSCNHALVHAGCIDSKGEGVLVAAFADTGKTRSTLGLCARTDCGFLSDDITIINSFGECLCFPSSSSINPRTLRNMKVGLPFRERLKLKMTETRNRMHPARVFGPSMKVQIEKFLPREKIVTKTKPSTIVFLEKGNESVQEIDQPEAESKLSLITEKEIPWFTDSITNVYGYFNKLFDVKDLMQNQQTIIGLVTRKAKRYFIVRSNGRHDLFLEKILTHL